MNGHEALHVIVLAAGKGTRMKSDLAKVLHPVFFKPMIRQVLDVVSGLSPKTTVVVTGHQAARVEKTLAGYPLTFVRQDDQRGTGHAVLCAEATLAGQTGTALILCGDTPLVRVSTLREMVASHHRQAAAITVMTTVAPDPTHYGRIVGDDQGGIERIVEEKDASPEERLISEINAGIYLVGLDLLFAALRLVGSDNRQGEVYLTDIVAISRRQGRAVGRYRCPDPLEVTGVNSRLELALANGIMRQRRNQDLMLAGVTMIDPDSIWVADSVRLGRDVEIHSHCLLAGETVVGSGCRIEPFCHLVDCRIEEDTVVRSFSGWRGTGQAGPDAGAGLG